MDIEGRCGKSRQNESSRGSRQVVEKMILMNGLKMDMTGFKLLESRGRKIKLNSQIHNCLIMEVTWFWGPKIFNINSDLNLGGLFPYRCQPHRI